MAIRVWLGKECPLASLCFIMTGTMALVALGQFFEVGYVAGLAAKRRFHAVYYTLGSEVEFLLDPESP